MNIRLDEKNFYIVLKNILEAKFLPFGQKYYVELNDTNICCIDVDYLGRSLTYIMEIENPHYDKMIRRTIFASLEFTD